MNSTPPSLSVVIGAKNAHATIVQCIKALAPQAERWGAEILLVDASSDGTADIVRSLFPQQVKVIECEAETLVPALWKRGIDESRGEIIALTIGQCTPAADWLEQIIAGHRDSAAGVGGPIDGPVGGSGADWALYFTRYSAFMPPGTRGPIHDIPGDNASYKRRVLESCQAEMRDGFWETLVHVKLRAEGQQIIMRPEMLVRLGQGESLGETLRTRFRHGRHYGSTRPGNSPTTRLARLLTSPLILPTLLLRAFRRVQRARPDWTGYFFRALPALLLIQTAWTLGETSGYAWPKRETLTPNPSAPSPLHGEGEEDIA